MNETREIKPDKRNEINYKKLMNKTKKTDWDPIYSIHVPNIARNWLIDY